MPAGHPESTRRLTRDEEKQLLALACAADRLEWQIRAQQVAGLARRSAAVSRLLRAGVEWLPRVAGRGPARAGPRWRRALFWVRAGLGLLL